MHLDYIKEFCELPPLNRPEYDADTETYDIYFAERMDGGNPYGLEQEMICLAFETLEEANEILTQALESYYDEENNQED
jgi:hypothetical protein